MDTYMMLNNSRNLVVFIMICLSQVLSGCLTKSVGEAPSGGVVTENGGGSAGGGRQDHYNGWLDRSYATSGCYTFSDAKFTQGAAEMHRLSDGFIVTADNTSLISRHDENGNLLTAWAANGFLNEDTVDEMTGYVGLDKYKVLAVDSSDRILVADGTVMCRLLADPSLDTSFGTNGCVTIGYDEPHVAEDASGNYWVVYKYGGHDMMAKVFSATGSIVKQAFYVRGHSSIETGYHIRSLHFSNSKLYVSYLDADNLRSIPKFFAINADYTFDYDNSSILDGNLNFALGADSNGNLIVGRNTSAGESELLQINADYSVDQTLGTEATIGKSIHGWRSITPMENGGMLVLAELNATDSAYSSNFRPLFLRYNGLGELVSTYAPSEEELGYNAQYSAVNYYQNRRATLSVGNKSFFLNQLSSQESQICRFNTN